MAITGRFAADFASFYDAVQRAEVSLKGFEQGAGKVETSLNRMTDSLSGTKIVQQATIAAEAVDRIGGVSKLTDAELARVGATATEAANKLRAMGQDVPPGIQKIADAAKETGGLFQDLGTHVAATALGFVSAEAIIHGVELAFHTVIDAAKELGDIALTGAGVADVEENFKRLTTQAGMLGDQLMGTLRAGTHETITNFELMKTVNQDLGAGMKLTDAQFGTLATGAFALAQATGGSVKDGLDTMNDAMLTGRTRALALLTGKIDLAAAETKYAATLGVSRDNLSDSGKLEAARIGILDAVAAATARLGVQTDGLDERVAQAQVTWGNFKEDLGKTIATSTVLETGMAELGKALVATFGGSQQALIAAVAHKVDDATIALVSLGESAVSVGAGFAKEFYAVKKVVGDVTQVIDGVTLATLYLGKAQLTLPNAIGVGTAAWTANDAAIGHLLVTMKARGDALQEDDRAQAGVDATAAKYTATLEGLRTKMEAARTTSTTLVPPLVADAAAHADAAAAAANHGEALTKLSPAQEAAAKKFAEAAAEVNAAGVTWQATVATINVEVLEHLRVLTAAGVSMSSLETFYKLTTTQGTAFNLMLKDEAEQSKLVAGQVAATAVLWADYYKAVGAASHDTTATQIENVWLAANAQILAMDKAKTLTIADYDIIAKTAAQATDNIIRKELEADVHSQAHFFKLADEAKIAYEKAAASSGQYTAEWIQHLRETADAAQLTADSWWTSFDTSLAKIDTRTKASADAMVMSWSQAMSAVSEGLGTMTATVQAAMTQSQMEKAAAAAGGTVAYDSHNNPYIYIPGVNAPGVRAGGGPVSGGQSYLVGERGPELYTPGANGFITPNGGGGGNVTNHIYVNGTAEDVARKVMDEITKTMKNNGRKWPSA